jgi:hypothetical protein
VSAQATFYTIANSRFFVGAVALLNSLRLVGHAEPLVVLDAGLAPGQRRLLEGHARIVSLPDGVAHDAYLSKPYPHLAGAEGVVALIDSDVIVTRPLGEALEAAAAGKICLYPEHHESRGRFFASWAEALSLREPLRREPYMGGGFVVLSVDRWPGFLERWWEACGRVPPGQHFGRDMEQPFWAGDMDALNALLMSEVPPGSVETLPEDDVVLWDELPSVRVVDAATLDCRRPSGLRPAMLHYSFSPKPWEPKAWLRVRDDSFCRLLPRVLFGDDVALRLDPRAVPVWVRPERGGRAVLRALDGSHAAVRAGVFALPGPVRRPLLAARNELFRRLRR